MLAGQPVIEYVGYLVVLFPLLLTILLGASSLLDRKLTERATTQYVSTAMICALLAAVTVLAYMLFTGDRHVASQPWSWVEVANGYHFRLKLIFDRLSVAFAILSIVLSGTIGAFASKYMHRERGFNRFFVLYAIFVLGMVLTSLAGTIETLFTGWELVGLSSALLVAFFQERPAPARNGLWIWVIYRFSDAALLLAAVVMHHFTGEGDFDKLLGSGAWPDAMSTVTAGQALLAGLLILVAAAGKSALVPFSGWLPRAMEGPTPSSAVFYGALSVHLGAFLLLRVSPLLEKSLLLCVLIVLLGLLTAIFAYFAGSVQTDIKSALSFASLSQVGMIVAEIGLGSGLQGIGRRSSQPHGWLTDSGVTLLYIALFHLLGHACLRTLQFVRAPSLLQDYNTLENAIGQRLPRARTPWGRLLKDRHRTRFYRLTLERGYLDSMLNEYIVAPYVRIFRVCDAWERRWTDFLAGEASRESDPVKRHFGTIEESS